MIIESQTVVSKEASPVSIDMDRDGIDSLAEKILAGKALLRVVAYPWGVEFDVCELPSPPRVETVTNQAAVPIA
jgi:hypothetical protein